MLAKRAVEDLNEGVLIRFAWLDVLDSNVVGFGPFGTRLPKELRSVVGKQHLWEAMAPVDAFENANEMIRVDRPIDLSTSI